MKTAIFILALMTAMATTAIAQTTCTTQCTDNLGGGQTCTTRCR